jgi:CheY-like chemotaxis protein
LGQLLIALGTVSSADLGEALGRQETIQEPLAKVLVEMELVHPDQLERAVRIQARLRGKENRDDDPEIGALLCEILEGAGYRVGVAESTMEAEVAALPPSELHPSLIVLDMGLPGTGGLGFLARLREEPTTRDIPVIVLTGNPDAEAEISGRGLAISEFLAKPVPARQLLESVRSVLARSATPVG